MTPMSRSPSLRSCLFSSIALTLAAALAGCVTPPPAPVIWDKSHLPTIEPLTVDGRCALVVSGTSSFKDKAFSRVSLNVGRGIARIEVELERPDPFSATTFHVVVPVEEQHVSVIYVGQTGYPVWERGKGGPDCAR
jgi:hypothetical protein